MCACLCKLGSCFSTNLFDRSYPISFWCLCVFVCTRVPKVRMIDRKQEVPHTGLMCDLLWSDPDCQANDFTLSPRGAGYLFGEKAINEFGHANKISLLCRAHQLVMEGFKWHFNKRVLTIWSAPNYCYRCGNIASLFEYHGGAETPRYTFKMFREAPQEERAIPTRPAAPDYFL
eukprot:m.40451 g.40451  ORF g.40451 m.40451 type:complete len:174 (+) comp10354_c0_seq3:7-528(+)